MTSWTYCKLHGAQKWVNYWWHHHLNYIRIYAGHLQVCSSRRYGSVKTSLRLNGEKPFRYLWSVLRSSMLADMCHTALGVNALFINPEERRTVNTNREEVWLREVVWVSPVRPISQDSLVTVDWFHLCAAFSLRHKSLNAVMRPGIVPKQLFPNESFE